ncbi:MAG: hypothetical protein PHP13_03645 [Methanomicrobium sp.]|nr:hypothetical protein [Methanomicrobium sp.]MDD4300644.1 hypothetical protein [Methanomicrobium sp.]
MEDLTDQIAQKDLFLIFSEATAIKNTGVDIVGQLSALEYNIIVVTSNQPYSNLIRNYEERKIDVSSIFFVDMITRYALGKEPETNGSKNYNFISSPSNLTGAGIAINEFLIENDGKKTAVVFDSVTTMLIYLSSDKVSKFLHYLTNKFRIMGVKGFFLAVDGGIDPALEVMFTTFMDCVIRTNKKN